MSLRLVLDELAAVRQSLDKATALLSQSATLTNQALLEDRSSVNNSSLQDSPITVVTENGFSIARLCEREESSYDPSSGCDFLVRAPNGRERRIRVVFAAAALTLLQEHSAPSACLPKDLRFWVRCSEDHLSTYLWKNDCYPPGERLIVDTLTPDNLLLARRMQ